MLAPIQMQSFQLIELHFSANPAFEKREATPDLRISVRGLPLLSTAEEDREEDALPLHLDVETSFARHDDVEGLGDDVGIFQTSLTLEINTDDDTFARAPFACSVAALGVFSAVRLPADEEERVNVFRIIRANSAALLYGSLRQILLQTTQASPHTPLILPSIQFKYVVEREEQAEAEAEPEA